MEEVYHFVTIDSSRGKFGLGLGLGFGFGKFGNPSEG